MDMDCKGTADLAADTSAVAVTSVAGAPAMSVAVVILEEAEEAIPAAMAVAATVIDKNLTLAEVP